MPETSTNNVPAKTDYRATLNLPATNFPMRAELPKREPARVAWWAANDTYGKRLARNRAQGGTPWILHDGPPYANGDLHMGHFLNRFLKDAFVKIALLDGRWADFIPGWDMHGLPIERETLTHLGVDFHKIDPIELRARCKDRALYWLDRQRTAMLRMGLFGHYERPYMTIAPEFEATIADTLADLAESGQLYKGLRSTLWCVSDETALAEAEIEYNDRTSPSIYVRFRANPAQRADLLARFGAADDGTPLSIVIWTTTPWTLPGNVAIALKPDAEYAVYRLGAQDYIFAVDLAPAVLAALGAAGPPMERGRVTGEVLAGAAVRHPFLDRDSVVVTADYVDLVTGTGAVHTAPGHGTDDFETGVKFGLPILNPVDAAGTFLADAGPYAGRNIFEAQQQIIDDLAASGALVRMESYDHSYPHCWRCKNPVIFRATAQWFISLDANGLRARIEQQIPSVAWLPAWGEARMTQMIANHPEWCVSRQRTWGTPIPALACKTCGESIVDPRVARIVASRFRSEGPLLTNASDMWWTDDVTAFLPPDLRCPTCGGTTFEKEYNIVDIWFESGVTHRAVLRNGGLPWPADLYLEGSDQYRGWFRSNLITSVAVFDAPPYKGVVSTGMVVDAEGRAMHKSDGNYIGAVEGMEKYGADVLRLWAASVEYTADMRLGAKMLETVANVYRNLRNRLRFFLSAVGDLPAAAVVTRAELEPVDRLALAALDRLAKDVVDHYRAFRLHDAYLALVAFDNDDLSRFYIAALKDRLYSSAPDAPRRRSAQSALLEMLRTIAVLLAPVLSFTAEEAWQALPAALRGSCESVFDIAFPQIADVDAEALTDWQLLKDLRAEVAATGAVDFALDARIDVPPASVPRLRAMSDNVREALIVSSLLGIAPSANGAAAVTTEPAHGEKCARCWKYLPLGSDPQHPLLCAPCAQIVSTLPSPAAR
ncbi:MAG: isoleucine--tRNA ligase [Candidatus Velthaea sp.]